MPQRDVVESFHFLSDWPESILRRTRKGLLRAEISHIKKLDPPRLETYNVLESVVIYAKDYHGQKSQRQKPD